MPSLKVTTFSVEAEEEAREELEETTIPGACEIFSVNRQFYSKLV